MDPAIVENSQVDLVDEADAAEALKTTPNVLRQSRHTGLLYGRPAPRFFKLGRKVLYRRARLVEFLDQFNEYANTTEARSRDDLEES